LPCAVNKKETCPPPKSGGGGGSQKSTLKKGTKTDCGERYGGKKKNPRGNGRKHIANLGCSLTRVSTKKKNLGGLGGAVRISQTNPCREKAGAIKRQHDETEQKYSVSGWLKAPKRNRGKTPPQVLKKEGKLRNNTKGPA